MLTCKDCTYKKNDACTLKHIRVSVKTESCSSYSEPQMEIDTRTCATCKHHYFPDKDYKNYSLYINHKGEFFLCKCELDKWAKFINKDKCKNYESN